MSLSNNLIVQQMQVGPMENFIYFVGDAQTKKIAVVDPAWDVGFLCQEAERQGFSIEAVLLTHGHPDHVNGLEDMLARYDVPAYISRHEAKLFKPVHKNLIETDDHQKLTIGGVEFECLWTPGHSPGCQCFYSQNVLIAGDAIFIDGCGRCDLPGSDPKAMYRSLYNVIMKLSDETMIYPGHDYGPVPYATLASQKKTNPYLSCRSQEEFLSHRMGIAF